MADDFGFMPDTQTVRLWGCCSIRSEGIQRDQRLLLTLNGNEGQGAYISWSFDTHPPTLGFGPHGPAERSASNGLIVGYAGNALDVDVIFDATLSIAVGRPRLITGTYTVTRGGNVMYLSYFGGSYLGIEPIQRGRLTLPDGGEFIGDVHTGSMHAGN